MSGLMMGALSTMQRATSRIALSDFQFIWANIQVMQAPKPQEIVHFIRGMYTDEGRRLRDEMIREHYGSFDRSPNTFSDARNAGSTEQHELIPLNLGTYSIQQRYRALTREQSQCEAKGWNCVFVRQERDMRSLNYTTGMVLPDGRTKPLSRREVISAKPSDYPLGISTCLVQENDGLGVGTLTFNRPSFPQLLKTTARLRLGIDTSQTRSSTMSDAFSVAVVFPAALDAKCLRGKRSPALSSGVWEDFLGDCLKRLSKLATERGILLMSPQAYCGLLRYEPTETSSRRLFDQTKRYYWHAFDSYCNDLLTEKSCFLWEAQVETALKDRLRELGDQVQG